VRTILTLASTGCATVAYLTGVARLRLRGDRWPWGRALCTVGAAACVAAALVPPVVDHDELFPVHIAQHLLLGMVAPMLLAMSAPVTLVLRATGGRFRRGLLVILHSRVLGWLASPPVAVATQAGGLYALYLTGLYAATERSEGLHLVVHLHMFLAGCLVAWVVLGVDPLPRRGVAVRLVTLALAGAAHDTLSKLMYAHDLPAGGGPVEERRLGAEILYYGDTVVMVAMAVVVMAQWWRLTGRSLAHQARRTDVSAALRAGRAGRPGRG